jgi:hypothetical protein
MSAKRDWGKPLGTGDVFSEFFAVHPKAFHWEQNEEFLQNQLTVRQYGR